MSIRNTKVLTLLFIATLVATSISFAQEAPTSTPTTDTSSQLDISVSIEKDDFLLFYGNTKDKETNDKLDLARKDFMEKFNTIKEDYKKSVNELVVDSPLISPVSLTNKDLNKITTQVKKIESKVQTVKKYIMKTDKASSTDIIISPIVNIIDTASTIHTENSSWFHKIKSIFNW